MYILADIKKIVENQDLYRNKEDFWFFHIQQNSYCLMLKIFIFNKS